jgi:hypothetical protein
MGNSLLASIVLLVNGRCLDFWEAEVIMGTYSTAR